MRKGKSLIGKDILTLEDGAKLEKVNGVIVDPGGQRLVALVVDQGGLMSSTRVVPIEEVSSFGRDAVVIGGRGSIVTTAEAPGLKQLVEQSEKIVDKKVFTVTGDEQGTIADIYFDESSGKVLGYEVSGGVIGDVAKGTSYLPSEEITSIGDRRGPGGARGRRCARSAGRRHPGRASGRWPEAGRDKGRACQEGRARRATTQPGVEAKRPLTPSSASGPVRTSRPTAAR